jgi:hypothetical protein
LTHENMAVNLSACVHSADDFLVRQCTAGFYWEV